MRHLTVSPIALLTLGLLTLASFKSDSDQADKKFLRKIADARMMDWAEGELAAERGTTADIKAYGERMIKDQDAMMSVLKNLAASKSIVLPQALSNRKADGLDDLKRKVGKDFDKLFLKMISKDHRRDIRDFKKALNSDDPKVREFVNQYLPLIEDHLEKAEALNNN